jgi:hypothetical protein
MRGRCKENKEQEGEIMTGGRERNNREEERRGKRAEVRKK